MVMLPLLRLAGETPRVSRGKYALIGVVDTLYEMVHWLYRGWFGHGGFVSSTSSTMGCKTHLTGMAGPFHRDYFFGINVGMLLKKSYTPKLVTIRIDDMSILTRGSTTLQRLMDHGRYHSVNVAMWPATDDDD